MSDNSRSTSKNYFSSHYDIGEVIGRGTYSTVRLVRPTTTRITSADIISPRNNNNNQKYVNPSSTTTVKSPPSTPPTAAAANNNNNNHKSCSPTTSAVDANTSIHNKFAAKIFLPQLVENTKPATPINQTPQRAHRVGSAAMMSTDYLSTTTTTTSPGSLPRLSQHHHHHMHQNVNDNTNMKNAAFDQAASEARLLAACPVHPNILHLHEAFVDENTEESPVIITQLANGDELFQILSRRRSQEKNPSATTSLFRESEVREIIKQLLSALAALHKSEIVHRDVKLENILWCESSKKLTLVDFGMATSLKAGQRLTGEFCGSPHYVSPEMLRAASKYGVTPTSSNQNTPVLRPSPPTPQQGEECDEGAANNKNNHTDDSLMMRQTSSTEMNNSNNISPSKKLQMQYLNMKNNNNSKSKNIPAPELPFVAFGEHNHNLREISPSSFVLTSNSNSNAAASTLQRTLFAASSTENQESRMSAVAAGGVSPGALLLMSRNSQLQRNTSVEASSSPANNNNNNIFSFSSYGKEIDLWATGVCMYVLIEGQYPFHNEKSKLQWHKSVLEGTFRPAMFASKSATKLLNKLLEIDPLKRVSASEALLDDFFLSSSMDEDECDIYDHEDQFEECEVVFSGNRHPHLVNHRGTAVVGMRNAHQNNNHNNNNSDCGTLKSNTQRRNKTTEAAVE